MVGLWWGRKYGLSSKGASQEAERPWRHFVFPPKSAMNPYGPVLINNTSSSLWRMGWREKHWRHLCHSRELQEFGVSNPTWDKLSKKSEQVIHTVYLCVPAVLSTLPPSLHLLTSLISVSHFTFRFHILSSKNHVFARLFDISSDKPCTRQVLEHLRYLYCHFMKN